MKETYTAEEVRELIDSIQNRLNSSLDSRIKALNETIESLYTEDVEREYSPEEILSGNTSEYELAGIEYAKNTLNNIILEFK